MKEQLRYETIFGESEVFRADLPKFEVANLVVKQGQQWEPRQDNIGDDLCQLVPRDFDELSLSQRSLLSNIRSRVKILHGAHASLMCIIICTIAHYPECVQLAVLQKHHELA